MVTYYLDTSALLKWYLKEIGSDWLRRTLAPTHQIVIVTTQLLIVEVISALNRRVRESTVTKSDYARLTGRFRDDCRDIYQIVALSDTIINTAWTLLEHHPLRAYDAIHLATALTINQHLVKAGEAGLTFLSADTRLNNAGGVEGLAVDNPNDYL